MRLSEFLRDERDIIIDDWETRVRGLPTEGALVEEALVDHIPDFLVELSGAIEEEASWFDEEAARHADQRSKLGVPFAEVVAEYELLRKTVHRLYRERSGEDPLDSFDRGIDLAIAKASEAYAEPARQQN
jgi:hypothetical protein